MKNYAALALGSIKQGNHVVGRSIVNDHTTNDLATSDWQYKTAMHKKLAVTFSLDSWMHNYTE